MKINTKQSLRSLTDQVDTVAVPALERSLGHRDPELRAAAVAALQARGEAGFYALLRAAAHGNRLQRLEAVTCLGTMQDVRALQPLLASLINDRRERTSRSFGRFCLAVLVTCFSVHAAAPLWAETFCANADLQICAAEALGNLGDVRAMVSLIRLSREPHLAVRMAARRALDRLLPRVAELTPEQARGLGANAISELSSLLSDYDEPLTRQALVALYAIGDRQAIPNVTRLANSPDRPYLHREAQRLLVVLTERVVQEQLRTTLLRGSRLPSVSADPQLLRPATATPNSEGTVGQLLRPIGEDCPRSGI